MEFWALNYFAEGRYPTGNFSWAHMWFVAYLLAMTVVCYPIFLAVTDPRMRAVTDWFERTARSPAIYLLGLLPLAFHLALAPVFPCQTTCSMMTGPGLPLMRAGSGSASSSPGTTRR